MATQWSFEFAAGTTLAPGQYLVIAQDVTDFMQRHPGIRVVGEFSGRLSDSDERILLLDARGNLADEVHYYDGGRWPESADAGGSSLELRDPRADNSRGEAWSASDEAEPVRVASFLVYAYRGAPHLRSADLISMSSSWDCSMRVKCGWTT